MVEGDVYYIESRLKEIDPGYFLVRKGRTVEVHHAAQKGGTRALTVPYETLDARTVELVRVTRAERAERYIETLEAQGRRAERQKLSKVVDRAAKEAERVLREVKP